MSYYNTFAFLEFILLFSLIFLYKKKINNFNKLSLKIKINEKILEQKINENSQLNIELKNLLNLKDNLNNNLQELEIKLVLTIEKNNNLKFLKLENNDLKIKILNQLEIISDLKSEISKVKTELKDSIIFFEKKEILMTKNKNYLNLEFMNLANKIFENNEKRIHESNKKNIKNIINPLKNQLNDFKNQLQNNLNQESSERNILTYELRNLQKLNNHLSQEAINLTNALKGNNKIQGNWGELILNKILESSGLRKGYEYEIQKIIKLKDKQKKIQPDIIIKLPHNKNIIIDSKMTLVAYERYFNSDDNKIKNKALDEHILAIRNHVRLLSNKNYQNLPNMKTLDYIIMFIPIEPAFLIAIGYKPSLLNEALKQNIMLVSPTTLMVTLRTISNLWRFDKQNKNSLMIVDKATKLYNKIRLFIEDIYNIEKSLNKLQDNYNSAKKKLFTGKGNIISQAENFRNLGIEVVSKINKKYIEND
ncbi:DNA recombination protein RmuC [Enterobacteriaceae endosymbiont of Plateumaris consimilis]|uniref:DNA recombination protein RmuC n=1 Tax=Enterobacteriaceae endosymbiont of Plateumaris consimilis TaxID=2675794 RepID=UPI00144A2B46|nr:DNA recombination protein RmuC [Enterobacteriaceae endosymbiont of Plateumaris consimilis]QJC28694.1 DNA recombination protein RmuC [Enterobacteriaceae endosymbiont of Plateumaris consimilis]